jgi:hypothetical protein
LQGEQSPLSQVMPPLAKGALFKGRGIPVNSDYLRVKKREFCSRFANVLVFFMLGRQA